jgi:hypothetical protein
MAKASCWVKAALFTARFLKEGAGEIRSERIFNLIWNTTKVEVTLLSKKH